MKKRSGIPGKGDGPALKIWFTAKNRPRFSLDLIALKKQLETGTLSDFDRRQAEDIMPDCCDFVTGKIDRLPLDPAQARAALAKARGEEPQK